MNRRNRFIFLVALIFCLSAISAGAFEWQHTDAKSARINGKTIQDVFASLGPDVYSCVIIRDGKIVDEYFKKGYSRDSVFSLQSCSKSITGALIGIAIEQGYIKSIDDFACDYLPELKSTKYADMKRITIRQLLNNTSGLLSTDSKVWSEWQNSSDWINYILSKPMTAVPGKYFEYSTGNTHLLAAILERVTGKKLLDYTQEVLFQKIGITSAKLTTDPKGIGDGGNGFYLSAYDMARFGQLFLDKGKWEGKQVVPEKWVKESTVQQAYRSSTGSRYGYQWWIRNYGKAGYLGYNAQGFGGEYIFVVPPLNLIVVYTSQHWGSKDSYFVNVDRLVNACTK